MRALALAKVISIGHCLLAFPLLCVITMMSLGEGGVGGSQAGGAASPGVGGQRIYFLERS